MLSLYRTLSTRYLGSRWFRSLLIVASIALGVGTLVATRALTETMNRAGLRKANPLAGAADLLVSGSGDSRVPLSLARKLVEIEGVKSTHPRIFTKIKMPERDNRSALLVGIEVLGEEAVDSPWKITWRNHLSHKSAVKLYRQFVEVWNKIGQGQKTIPPSDSQELMQLGFTAMNKLGLTKAEIDALTKLFQQWLKPARKEGPDAKKKHTWVFGLTGKQIADELPPGKLLELRAAKEGIDFSLLRIGTVDAAGAFASLGGNTVILDIDSVNTIFGWKGEATRIDLILDPNSDRDRVLNDIRARLPSGVVVRTPNEQNDMLQNVFAGMQTGFSLCGIAALVVGLFLVYNVLSYTVTERRHEIGVMRSVGATRLHVELLFVGEAAILGLSGGLLGIPLGLGLAYLGLEPVQRVLRTIAMDIDARYIEVSWQVLALAVTAGLLTAVVAALIPAWKASHENPAEAVRRVPAKHDWRFRSALLITSATLICAGTICILVRDFLPAQMGTFGGLMLVLPGALMTTPVLAEVIGAAIRPLVCAVTGIEGRLAADNLVRSASRTWIVIAALAAGVALVVQTAGVIRSNNAAIRGWIEKSIQADLVVTSGSPVGAGLTSDDMQEDLGSEIEKVAGVEKAVPLKSTRAAFRKNKLVYVLAADYQTLNEMNAKRGHGNPLLLKLDQPGAAIISQNFSLLHNVRAGETIALDCKKGEVKFRVVGVMEDYSWNLGSVFINRAEYSRLWGDDNVEIFDVFISQKETLSETRQYRQVVKERILKKLGAENALVALTRGELQTHVLATIDGIYDISEAQLMVVMCVAALGVVTALLISVLQRRREMGLLRAIGASRFQVVHSVLAEAALMGVVGTIIGILVGIPLQWYMLNVIMREEFGYLFPLHIPWTEALGIAGVAVLLATIAGLGPAIYGVRMPIPEAIATE